jgi:hypothetical protein
MARYEVRIIERPQGWTGASPDDVPPQPGEPLRVLTETDDLFAAVRAAIRFNETARSEASAGWAVVVEAGSPGSAWPNARLCTPLGYRVAAVGWPTGWEPQSPLDVPRCLGRAQGETDPVPLSYDRALAVVRGLNQQSMDHAGSSWYVLMAVENEPISQTVSYDPSGAETTVQVRRLHVVVPDEGGRGDCSYCPARSLPCATGDLRDAEQTAGATSTRSLMERDDLSSLST